MHPDWYTQGWLWGRFAERAHDPKLVLFFTILAVSIEE